MLNISYKYRNQIKDFINNITFTEFNITDWGTKDIDNMKNRYLNFWVELKDDKVVGTLGVYEENGCVYIARVYIDNSLRGSGIATNMMNTALEYCKSLGYTKVHLSTIPEMERANFFYVKMGFKKVPSLPDGTSKNKCCYIKTL